ncbi:HD domain-containing protein [Thermodesulforhabdus norvegica]|uniref:Bifunctional uridylyltransferase/uridylyl-removing enzyme n=1 Tax=Thermodesulforhabdus norvegica TaxID=39841 RepID=A0A1I4TU89_9BACT|nr:HD domain-containing protein [Thermodesulforhabdus norvegica]SFM80123.1 UTP--GlnB (protein PII) uridylyltransferase, GlnD [Thermodesulforhabdus norvegica]
MVLYEHLVDSLKTQRQKYADNFGEESITGHTTLVEISLISLYNRLINVLDLDAEAFRANGALVATGDLGKSFIGPHQPITLIFLKTPECRLQEEWLREIIDPLIEAGWKVDYTAGTVQDIIAEAEKNIGFLQNLITSRYISGNRKIFEDLDAALEDLLKGRGEEIEGQLRKEWTAGMELVDRPGAWMEPDLFAFPGGIRSITTIRTVLRLSGFRKIDEAVRDGFLNHREGENLLKAERFLTRVLNVLMSLENRSERVMGFPVQRRVAEQLGYSNRGAFSAAEVFMQELHRYFFETSQTLRLLFEKKAKIPVSYESVELEPGVFLRDGRVEIDDQGVELSPELFVRIFLHAAKNGALVGGKTLDLLRGSRHILETCSGNRRVLDELLELVHSDSPVLPVFRLFHDMGFLGDLIPEWKGILGLMQCDGFHEYPFHEHALRTLQEVKKVLGEAYRSDEPELSSIARRINDPRWLYLAALLHDIGKSAGRDHALRGGEMIPAIARRLGMLPEESDMVQFLVGQHTLIMDSASMRDIGDEEMLAHCSLLVGDTIRLDNLLVLTFADLKATGEKAFRKWHQSPMIFLHERLSQILEKGEPRPGLIAERIEQIKQIVQREVSDLMDESQVVARLEDVGPRYLLSMEPATIARHLRMEWELLHSPEPFVLDVTAQDKTWTVTLLSETAPWLLFKTAGLLTLHSIDISAAQVFVKNNGTAILIFNCSPTKAATRPDWESFRADLKRLMEHRFSLDFRLAKHAALTRPAAVNHRPGDTRVIIDNESSAHYTILEVHTADRTGLLYLITKTLADLDIRIYVAKITTRGSRVADVFYIRDHLDRKLSDSEQIEELRSALLYWLDEAYRQSNEGFRKEAANG